MIFSGRHSYNIPRGDFGSSFHIAKVLQRILYLNPYGTNCRKSCPHLKESLSYYKKIGFQCSAWKYAYLCQTKSLTIFLNPYPYSRPCLNLFGAQEKKTSVTKSGTWIKERKEKIKYSTIDTKSLLGNYAGVCIETLDIEASFIFW